METKKTRIGIVGVTGYSGECLLEILLKHQYANVTYVSANNTIGELGTVLPRFYQKTNLFCNQFNEEKVIELCDVVFLCVPHKIGMQIAPKLLANNKIVIDLSADYRLQDPQSYEKWYGAKHTDTHNLPDAVYGMPELFFEKIKQAKLIANPGCYATSILLGIVPILSKFGKHVQSIVVDAKSGTSGAGKKAKLSLIATEINENMKAYKVFSHQHLAEIQECSKSFSKAIPPIHFVPHLLPINRGILSTIYFQFSKQVQESAIRDAYKNAYSKDSFVRIYLENQQPEIKHVLYTNYCDIGIVFDPQNNFLAVTSVIDNLMKGASSQAVQNMNIIMGYNQKEGIETIQGA